MPSKPLKIEQATIESLRPDPRNPRRMNRHEAEALQRSLEEYGAVEPAVVNADGTIIGGHMRVEAARMLGWRKFPVLRVELSDEKARLLNLALNRIHGEWDEDKLAEMLWELRDVDADLALSGFESRELDHLLDLVGGPDREIPDPDELPADPATRVGDLIVLGRHRLLCGDASDPDAVDWLLDGDTCHALMTDPPYGVGYVGKTADALELVNDVIPGLEAMVEAALRNVCAAAAPGAVAYVFHPDSNGLIFRNAFAQAGWDLKQVLIWVKQHFVLGRQDYQWQHEPILYGWKPGAHQWHGGFDQTTVIGDDADIAKLSKAELLDILREVLGRTPATVLHCDRPMRSTLHPTMKPVELCARLLANSSARGELVIDPFAGAGSTLMACEQLERRCYAMDIDPAYCDVIIDRWERYTGEVADRAGRTPVEANA